MNSLIFRIREIEKKRIRMNQIIYYFTLNFEYNIAGYLNIYIYTHLQNERNDSRYCIDAADENHDDGMDEIFDWNERYKNKNSGNGAKKGPLNHLLNFHYLDKQL